MGGYLAFDNLRVDGVMADIVAEIAYRFRPRSIVVTGGFGRGEASVFEEDGGLKFLSDCEILVSSRRPISRSAINRLALELGPKAGLEIVLHDSLRFRIYSWARIPPVISGRLWRPSIAYYELKHGSRVVFGEDILGRIPDIKPQDIPLWEGIRLMLNRIAAALNYFPADGRGRDESIYWINKVIFACQDALLLSVRQYHSSYSSRNLLFQELFPRHFSELNRRLPRFLSLASRATDYKLRPSKDAYPEDLPELWFDAAEICDQVFRYVIEKDMNITFDTCAEFQKRYQGHPKVRGEYYLGITSLPVFHNATTALRMLTHDSCRFPLPGLIARFRTPWKHIVYSTIPLVYFGLSREGEVSEPQLRQARNTISLFKRLEPQKQDPVEEWRYIKGQTLELWHTLCY